MALSLPRDSHPAIGSMVGGGVVPFQSGIAGFLSGQVGGSGDLQGVSAGVHRSTSSVRGETGFHLSPPFSDRERRWKKSSSVLLHC